VDFTILAATSVLGDLMEKCPPAEACRDAFERMSKATVQMCMSTTGFGPDVSNGQPGPKSEALSQPWPPSMSGDSSNLNSKPMAGQYQRPREAQAKARRPPPRFDMNLRDLFPNDINQEELASQKFSRQHQPRFLNQQNQDHQGQQEQQGQQGQQGQYDQAIPEQPQQQTQQYSFPQRQESANAQINTGQILDANQSSVGTVSRFPADAQQQQQQQYIQMQGNSPSPAMFYNTGLYDIDLTNMPGLDFLQSAEFNQNMDGTGIDIGFGPGMDFQHDWSDGTGVDMFDGFFFGNAAG
jgi:hypothetical protein